MKAAVWYNVYLQTKDRFALQRCVDGESRAIAQWKKIVESAGDVYPETLKFGVHRVGFPWHWKEELAKLEEGLEKLRELPSEETLDQDVRERIARRMTAGTRKRSGWRCATAWPIRRRWRGGSLRSARAVWSARRSRARR